MKNIYPPIADPYQYIQSIVLLSTRPRENGEQFLAVIARLPQEAQEEFAHIIQKFPGILPKIIALTAKKEDAALLDNLDETLKSIIDEEEKLLEEIEKFDTEQ